MVQYQYDMLGRLSSAATTGPEYGLTFAYDGFGNKTGQNVTKGSAPPHGFTIDGNTNRITNAGFVYDTAGNLTQFNGISLTYDGFFRNTKNQASGYEERWAHSGAGADRVMIQKKQGSTINGEYIHFYAPGGALLTMCEVKNVQEAWPYAGQLYVKACVNHTYNAGRRNTSRPRDIRDSDWQSNNSERKYPYGEMSTYTEGDHYATYNRMGGGVGLDYARNRTYAPTLGRFTSPDPYEESGFLEEPGSWNRYTYAWGDPTLFSDPEGATPAVNNGACLSSLMNVNPQVALACQAIQTFTAEGRARMPRDPSGWRPGYTTGEPLAQNDMAGHRPPHPTGPPTNTGGGGPGGGGGSGRGDDHGRWRECEKQRSASDEAFATSNQLLVNEHSSRVRKVGLTGAAVAIALATMPRNPILGAAGGLLAVGLFYDALDDLANFALSPQWKEYLQKREAQDAWSAQEKIRCQSLLPRWARERLNMGLNGGQRRP